MAVSREQAVAPASVALLAIARRISERLEDVGDRMLERYRAEIADYAELDDQMLRTDVLGISLDNLRALLANLERGEVLGLEELERAREGAARRVHQGVKLEELMHAFRIWGRVVWETVLETARADDVAEREAALQIAGRVMAHIDLVSTTMAQAYIEEAQGLWSDREVVRRDLLDALISGKADAAATRRQASALRLELREDYIVVLARRPDIAESGGETTPIMLRAAMRRVVDSAKMELVPESGSLLVGVRQGEVVALYPADGSAGVERLKRQCAPLASGVASRGFIVGIGGWHPGLAGIPQSYAEARDAVEIATRTGVTGRAVAFQDVLIEHILRSTPHSDRLLADALGPLREYDQARGADLVNTLRAYIEAGYNLTRSAQTLFVHPNTVVYRLRRIRELTGRDPGNPDDLLLLTLGLRIADLGETP